MGALLCYPSDKKYTINGRSYTLSGNTLGEGGFSFVYLAKDSNSKKYAIKIMICQTSEALAVAKKEVEIFKKFDHPNIMKLLDYSVLPSDKVDGAKDVVLVLPFYKDGSLQDLLDNQRTIYGKNATQPAVYNQKRTLDIFKQICNAVTQFHHSDPPLAHRDIKPGNVMVSVAPDGVSITPILLDFGSTRDARIQVRSRKEALSIQDDVDQTTTPSYRAPELFDISSDCNLDERVDIWALGCLLYAMAYNKSPFEIADDEPNGSVALTVLSGLPNQFPNNDYPKPFTDLIRNMVNSNKDERWNIDQVLEHIDNITRS
ncbi:hypothetical protein CYY_008305 [Polysphondylium violaceum]|uniref:non-specific serine/threonine protein kinase n=1 Tax=Polysphondylium violaceum TaxID=133409 RepID=A0A8J4PVG2_9MYCE|nr:hypothetical protein CYY_008305 [Polysphondylium violaceum]